jgi:hypothetical protein
MSLPHDKWFRAAVAQSLGWGGESRDLDGSLLQALRNQRDSRERRRGSGECGETDMGGIEKSSRIEVNISRN